MVLKMGQVGKGYINKERGKTMVGLIVVLIVALVVFMPLAVVWALNTLFGLAIAYTFKTWLAALIICGCVGGTKASYKSN